MTDVTAMDLELLRSMSTRSIRRNYWLCDEQLKMCANDSPRLDEAAAKLQKWQGHYLNELVRRGERV
jgi:hypothetical protein